ncbi:MAG: hypothetical protein FWC40_06165 [Proteobacteria bacterium]|nr:hypothetical protein [Pseudomonadota bacterium]
MKSLVPLMLGTVLAAGLAGCGHNDYVCDDETFVKRCLDATYLEICTHGELARYRCNAKEECIDAESGGYCREKSQSQ